MRSGILVSIVLLSGALAGAIHGGVNLVLVEPYLDDAIGIENRNLFESGQAQDSPEFWVEYGEYREWQKGGQVIGAIILGMSIGSLFGIVYALARGSLPGQHDVQKALVLAGIMFVVLFVIPTLKYPANPPTVGETDTVVLRATLLLVFVGLSGFSALGFYKLAKVLSGNKKILCVAGYVALVSIAAILLPDNPDVAAAPEDLINGFRIMSVIGVVAYWMSVSIILGLLWSKFRPNEHSSVV